MTELANYSIQNMYLVIFVFPRGTSKYHRDEVASVLYSITETAKANGLAVEKYLVYLFKMFANSEVKERDILEKCMP